MRLIVDADPLVYGCGFAAQGEPEHHALNLVKQQLIKYQKFFGSDDMSVHLSGSQGDLLRKQIHPDYKINRAKKPKPDHYQAIRDYLERHWNAQISTELEADDEVCLEANMYKDYSIWNQDEEAIEKDQMYPSCVIISIDKDLDQAPGWHFKPRRNPKEPIYYYVEPYTAMMWWGSQMIMGDSGDDIVGIPDVGKVKARDFMLELPVDVDFSDIREHTMNVYLDHGLTPEDWLETEDLVTMVQDNQSYANLLRSRNKAANRESGVAGSEVQDPEV